MNTNIINDITSYLTFKIGSNLYGIEVSKIQNILEMSRVIRIQHNLDNLVGYINQRGIMYPVIDMSAKFGIPHMNYTDNTCVLMLEVKQEDTTITFGSLIDSLYEVSEIRKVDIVLLTDIARKNTFISGNYIRDEKTHIGIIEPENLLTEKEKTALKVRCREYNQESHK
jgi:purine-binding chemotaxis protein CheW